MLHKSNCEWVIDCSLVHFLTIDYLFLQAKQKYTHIKVQTLKKTRQLCQIQTTRHMGM